MLERSPVAESAAPGANASPSCAVLVCSSDGYQDLWRPFFHLFWRYWPDCPFPVYLGSGLKSHDDGRVVTLYSPERNWTASCRHHLEQIESEYVLLLLEDFFLNQPVDSSAIHANLITLHSLSGSVLRLVPKPGPDILLSSHPGIGRLHRDAPYRVSLQAAIWNRMDLLALLYDRESAWEFEWNGTERSRVFPSPFLATEKTALGYEHVIERGEWFWSAARKYRREETGCDFEARRVMSPVTAAAKALNRLRKRALDAVLPPARRRRR